MGPCVEVGPRGSAFGGASVVSVADGARGYLQYLVVERGLAANTVESYRRDLNRYAEVLAARGKTELGDVTSLDVAEFRAALRTGDDNHPPLATSSVGRAVVAVRGLHAFARAQGLTVDDPAREVAPPPPPRRLPKAITIDEIERLLDAAGSTDDPDPRVLRDRALLEFLYGTGARISEVTGLDVDDLDHLARGPRRQAQRQGRQAALRPGRQLRGPRARRLPGARASRPRGRRRQAGVARPCSSTPGAAGSPGRARGGCYAKQRSVRENPMFHPTPCGTPSPPTSSTGAPTSASCRSCSDMPPSRRRRSTLW